jgi:hypothetical protein
LANRAPQTNFNSDSISMSKKKDTMSTSGASRDSHTCGDDDDNVSHSSSSTLSSAAEMKRKKPEIDVSIMPVDSIRNQTEERREEFMLEARANACAALMHLSKHCAISVSRLKHTPLSYCLTSLFMHLHFKYPYSFPTSTNFVRILFCSIV